MKALKPKEWSYFGRQFDCLAEYKKQMKGFFTTHSNPDFDILLLLLKTNRIVNARKFNEIFCKSCEKGNIELVKWLLLDERVEQRHVNAGFSIASFKGHVEVVSLLLCVNNVLNITNSLNF